MIRPRHSPTSRPAMASTVAAPSARTRWRWAYVLSSAVGVLALLASLAGLLADGVYGEAESTAEMLRGYDLVTLVFVVPALVLSQLSARRGSDRAQLMWVGMLAYLGYSYAYYLFGVPFSDLFLLHAAVFSCSLFALVLTVSALDVQGIAARYSPRTPRRIVAAVLGLLAAALGASGSTRRSGSSPQVSYRWEVLWSSRMRWFSSGWHSTLRCWCRRTPWPRCCCGVVLPPDTYWPRFC